MLGCFVRLVCCFLILLAFTLLWCPHHAISQAANLLKTSRQIVST